LKNQTKRNQQKILENEKLEKREANGEEISKKKEIRRIKVKNGVAKVVGMEMEKKGRERRLRNGK